MGEFRFHLTLTGRLKRTESDAVQATLHDLLAPLLPRPFVIRDICLFGQAADGYFNLLSRHRLGH